jgi:hypothetical protein
MRLLKFAPCHRAMAWLIRPPQPVSTRSKRTPIKARFIVVALLTASGCREAPTVAVIPALLPCPQRFRAVLECVEQSKSRSNSSRFHSRPPKGSERRPTGDDSVYSASWHWRMSFRKRLRRKCCISAFGRLTSCGPADQRCSENVNLSRSSL